VLVRLAEELLGDVDEGGDEERGEQDEDVVELGEI